MEYLEVINRCLIGENVKMKNIIRKILKEETSKGKRDKIDALLKALIKFYPKLDYCISNDNKIRVFLVFNDYFFSEYGLIFDPLEPLSDLWAVGEFTDKRDGETGKYLDRDIEMLYDLTPKGILEVLDDEFGIDTSTWPGQEHNYYGEPTGDGPLFDWRKC